jgi:hypothetical protein
MTKPNQTDKLLDEARKQPPADTPTGDTPGEQSGDGAVFSAEQQQHVDKIIADRLSRAREKWQTEAQATAEQDQAKAAAQQLEEEKKFQELADQRKAEIAELQPQVKELTADLEKYRNAISGRVKARLESVPDYLKPLLEDREPLEQFLYIEEHGAEWGQAPEGPPPSPKPGSEEITTTVRRQRAYRARL